MWLKLSDSAPLERRHRVLSDSANWLLVCLTAYSNREGTDGLVPLAELDMVRPGGDAQARSRALSELERAGAVEYADAATLRVCWLVPDQLTAEEAEKRKAQNRARQKRQRDRDAAARDGTRESQRDVTRYATRESQRESRTPVPSRPVPSFSSAEAEEVPRAGARSTKRAAPVPADWRPTDEHRAFAAKHGLDLELEAHGFRGYFEGSSVKSPNGRFATWLANSAKRSGTANGSARRPEPTPQCQVRIEVPEDVEAAQ